jgi:hypothetical protein
MTTDTAESAVRRYLTYLEDPSKLVDAATVKKLEAAAAKATDPLERLRALTALSTAKAPESEQLEEAFIQHAETWAKAEGIPVSSFAAMKVPKRVLDAAFNSNGGARRGRKPAGAVKGRRPRSSAVDVENSLLGMQGEFTVRDAIEASGASPVTIKNAIERLEAQGKVQIAGERAGARGRAARTWTVA